MKHTKEIALFLSISNARLIDNATYSMGTVCFCLCACVCVCVCVCVFSRFLCLQAVDNALALFSICSNLNFPKFS